MTYVAGHDLPGPYWVVRNSEWSRDFFARVLRLAANHDVRQARGHLTHDVTVLLLRILSLKSFERTFQGNDLSVVMVVHNGGSS